MAFGDYPPEYNPKVHGPYDPARYYGKRKYLFWLFILYTIYFGIDKKPYNLKLVKVVEKSYGHWFCKM